ncbi:hypothetical protein [Streptomyces chartreusis]|uniref:hypothetical protein n=1 Tax=Streptomyces chartreusis TaxID=1969 RepID=UPI003818E33F
MSSCRRQRASLNSLRDLRFIAASCRRFAVEQRFVGRREAIAEAKRLLSQRAAALGAHRQSRGLLGERLTPAVRDAENNRRTDRPIYTNRLPIATSASVRS